MCQPFLEAELQGRGGRRASPPFDSCWLCCLNPIATVFTSVHTNRARHCVSAGPVSPPGCIPKPVFLRNSHKEKPKHLPAVNYPVIFE